VEKIITIKSTRTIVALGAVSRRCDVVLLHRDVRDLTALAASTDRVAIGTTDTLGRCVVGMTEARAQTESITGWRCPAVRCKLMAFVALSNVAFGRVTGEAIGVSGDRNGNGFPRPARVVAIGAALARFGVAAGVCGMVELHIKSFFEFSGERQHRRRNALQVLVADRAKRPLLIGNIGFLRAYELV